MVLPAIGRQKATVRVVTRIRPKSKQEKEEEESLGHDQSWLKYNENINTVSIEPVVKGAQATQLDIGGGIITPINPKSASFKKAYKTFHFDKVYGGTATQQTMYDDNGKKSIETVLKGFSALLTTYGGVQSGKSYCMMGKPNSAEQAGLIPRMIDYLFERLASKHKPIVKVRYLQDYTGNFEDLLDPKKKKVIIRNGFPYNCRVATVENKKQLLALIKEGETRRSNQDYGNGQKNSRSHAVLIVDVEYLDSPEDHDMVLGRLWFLDLAGGEFAGQTDKNHRKGHTKEGSYINKSQLVLSSVINAIVHNARLPRNSIRRKFVPYRSSNLTKILKDALTGHFMWTLILTLSPTSLGRGKQLTRSTLKFGEAAAKLHLNKLRVNMTTIKTKVLLDQGQKQEDESMKKSNIAQLSDEAKEQIQKRIAIFNFSNRSVSKEEDIKSGPTTTNEEVEDVMDEIAPPKKMTEEEERKMFKGLKSSFSRFAKNKAKRKTPKVVSNAKKLKALFSREYKDLEVKFGLLPSSLQDIKRLCLLFPPLKGVFYEWGGIAKVGEYMVPGSKHYRYSNMAANFIATCCDTPDARRLAREAKIIERLRGVLNDVDDADQGNVQQVALAIQQLCDNDIENQQACAKHLLKELLSYFKESNSHSTLTYIALALQAIASGPSSSVQSEFVKDSIALKKLVLVMYLESQSVRQSVIRLISSCARNSEDFRKAFTIDVDGFSGLVAAYIEAQQKKEGDRIVRARDDSTLRYIGGAIFNLAQSKAFWVKLQNFKFVDQLMSYVLVHLASIANYSLTAMTPSLQASSEPTEHLYYRGCSFFGSFRGITCGGGLRSPNFRENPQYRLYVAEKSTIVFNITDKTPSSTLRKHNPVYMGFHIVRMPGNNGLTDEDDEDYRLLDVSQNVFQTPWKVGTGEHYEIVRSLPVTAGSYRLIAYQSRRDIESDFAFSMYTTSRENYIEPVVNDGYMRRVVRVTISGKNAGGMIESSPTWRNNPQFQVAVDEDSDILISIGRVPKLNAPTAAQEPIPMCLRGYENEYPEMRSLDLAGSQAKLGRYSATMKHSMKAGERFTFSASLETDEPITEGDELVITCYATCSFTLQPIAPEQEWHMTTFEAKSNWSASENFTVNASTKSIGYVIVSWKDTSTTPAFDLSITDHSGLNGPVAMDHIAHSEPSMVMPWEFEAGENTVTLATKDKASLRDLTVRFATKEQIKGWKSSSGNFTEISERQFVHRGTPGYSRGEEVGLDGMLSPQLVSHAKGSNASQISYTVEEELLIERIKKLEAEKLALSLKEEERHAASYETNDYDLLRDLEANVDRIELHFDSILAQMATSMTSQYESMLTKTEFKLARALAEIERLKGSSSSTQKAKRPTNTIPTDAGPTKHTKKMKITRKKTSKKQHSPSPAKKNDIILSNNKPSPTENEFLDKIRNIDNLTPTPSPVPSALLETPSSMETDPEFQRLRKQIQKMNKEDKNCVIM